LSEENWLVFLICFWLAEVDFPCCSLLPILFHNLALFIPCSKFVKLTLARLLIAQDAMTSHENLPMHKRTHSEEVLELFDDLVKLDPSHARYYEDERSLVIMNQVYVPFFSSLFIFLTSHIVYVHMPVNQVYVPFFSSLFIFLTSHICVCAHACARRRRWCMYRCNPTETKL